MTVPCANKMTGLSLFSLHPIPLDRSFGALFPRILPPAKSNGMRKLQLLLELLVNARWARCARRCESGRVFVSSLPVYLEDKWVFGGGFFALASVGRLLVNAIDLIAPSANGKRCLFCASLSCLLFGWRSHELGAGKCRRGPGGRSLLVRSRLSKNKTSNLHCVEWLKFADF